MNSVIGYVNSRLQMSHLHLPPQKPGDGDDDDSSTQQLPDGAEAFVEKEGSEKQSADQAHGHHAADKRRTQPLNGADLAEICA